MLSVSIAIFSVTLTTKFFLMRLQCIVKTFTIDALAFLPLYSLISITPYHCIWVNINYLTYVAQSRGFFTLAVWPKVWDYFLWVCKYSVSGVNFSSPEWGGSVQKFWLTDVHLNGMDLLLQPCAPFCQA